MLSSSLDALTPSLAQLADQAESATASARGLEDGLDAIPDGARDGWRRVLQGLAKGEGIEHWVVDPITRGLAEAGLDASEVTRFFTGQGADEARHHDLFVAYVERHWGPQEAKRSLLSHRLLYDGLFKWIIHQSEHHPLRLLMPLLAYEKAVSHYLTRLMPLAAEAMPRLSALMKDIRVDEARHVAGVGMTCRALIARRPPRGRERWIVATLCRLVIADMDRAPWWKPSLKRHIAAIGFDALAMRRENRTILAELLAMLDGK